jgi:predicted permease
MTIVTTIIPVFAVIFIGWLAHRRGWIPPEFIGPANHLVFYLSIPALIFRAIAKAPLARFSIDVIAGCLLAVLLLFGIAWGAGRLMRLSAKRRGPFTQCAFHGNLGYIGLAVAYYYMGDNGFARAGIIAGFVMILQNLLAVIALQANRAGGPARLRAAAVRVAGNPVILSALAGIGFSAAGLSLPLVLDRILGILSGLALPTALLLIGASISFDVMRLQVRLLSAICVLKLLVLPAVGLAAFRVLNVAPQSVLAGLVLLASPTATITYVMAHEMDGDTDIAVAAVSATTLLSSLTYVFWLHMAS